MSTAVRILLVVADPPRAAALQAALRPTPFEVDLAPDPASAARELARRRYDLVLADEAWARAAPLLAAAGKARVVALRDAPEAPELGVIPVGGAQLARFESRVRALAEPLRQAALDHARDDFEAARRYLLQHEARPVRRALTAQGLVGKARAELVLYVTDGSVHCHRALRNLRQVLAGYLEDEVQLEIYNLSQRTGPEAEADRVSFTPALVKRAPAPRAWVLGSLDDPTAVTDLLDFAGVRRKGA